MKNCKMIIGMARSGMASAEFLLDRGFKVVLYDSNYEKLKEHESIVKMLNNPLTTGIFGDNITDDILQEVEEAIVSPGVPPDIPLIKKITSMGIPLVSEIELAYRYLRAPIIGITGTNGKTTTTTLTYEIFARSHFKAYKTGNIGDPIINYADIAEENDMVIAEISSFQLENIEKFRTKLSTILNITPDHLDRHVTMENYINSKKKIFKNSCPEDYVLINADDEYAEVIERDVRCRKIYFSANGRRGDGAFLDSNMMKIADGNQILELIDIKDLKIPGIHNVKNALAASALAYFAGVEIEIIKQGLIEFTGVEHRLEFVRELNGIRFINDSKGTNTDAGIIALEAMSSPVILIAGGYDKKTDFSDWIDHFKGKVKKVFVIGTTADQIISTAAKKGFLNIEKCSAFKEAILKSYESAEKGDTVLLSPACASWDMFENFEVRGQIFKDTVKSLE
ncbi:MAG: UDP-N-acetylmuramoyl-L-alanine--D-glutamate ligase [Eubacteriaceae bacterium]|nr:UDP-N-acetylmuramoyl-L-alanine--D-glutamate ligase [Eubacteriaceae bacterium]